MKTLVLNANYKPLSIVNKKRAIILSLYNNDIDVVKYYDDQFFVSEKNRYQIPAVLWYKKFVKGSKKKYKPTKKAVLIRDNMTCQYCSRELDSINSTIDHIKPVSTFKSRNDSNHWTNLVACCRPCNLRKGNKTPNQAGMVLLSKPKAPSNLFKLLSKTPSEWKDYV